VLVINDVLGGAFLAEVRRFTAVILECLEASPVVRGVSC
jgi:hypothetical protein